MVFLQEKVRAKMHGLFQWIHITQPPPLALKCMEKNQNCFPILNNRFHLETLTFDPIIEIMRCAEMWGIALLVFTMRV